MAHASNLMNTIWTFRALYTVRYEFWLAHLLAVCAFRMVFVVNLEPARLDTFVKACQGLYELGERFGIARDVLDSVQALLRKHKLQLPASATKLMSEKVQSFRPGVMRYYTVVPANRQGKSAAQGYSHTRISDLIESRDPSVNVD